MDITGILGTLAGKTMRVSFGLMLGGTSLYVLPKVYENLTSLESYADLFLTVAVFSGGLWVAGILADLTAFLKNSFHAYVEHKEEVEQQQIADANARSTLNTFEQLPENSRYIVSVCVTEDTVYTQLPLEAPGMQELLDIGWISNNRGYRFEYGVWDRLLEHRREIRTYLEDLIERDNQARIIWYRELHNGRERCKRGYGYR